MTNLTQARLRSAETKRADRAAGLAYAARWRREQPFKALLDQLYGPDPHAGSSPGSAPAAVTSPAAAGCPLT